MSWTPERVEKLTELWKEGKTASQIAEELGGITRNAVIGKAHRLGLSGRPSPIKKGSGGAKRKPRAARAKQPRAAKPKPHRAVASRRSSGYSGPGVVSLPPRPPAEDGAAAKCFGPGVDIMQLTERTCRWPVGDPKKPGFQYCGHAIEPGQQYCEHHAAVAFQVPQPRREMEQVKKQARFLQVQAQQQQANNALQAAADEAKKQGENETGSGPSSPLAAVG